MALCKYTSVAQQTWCKWQRACAICHLPVVTATLNRLEPAQTTEGPKVLYHRPRCPNIILVEQWIYQSMTETHLKILFLIPSTRDLLFGTYYYHIAGTECQQMSGKSAVFKEQPPMLESLDVKTIWILQELRASCWSTTSSHQALSMQRSVAMLLCTDFCWCLF